MAEKTVFYTSWDEAGIDLSTLVGRKCACPLCGPSRKNSKDKSLSVDKDNNQALCHHCETAIVIKEKTIKVDYTPKVYQKPNVIQLPLSERTISFFNSRGISPETLKYFKVTESKQWMYERGEAKAGTTLCIDFNYYDDNDLINVKFRGSLKRFKLVSGAKLIFYNLNAIKNSDWCAIQEGEIDTMTAHECGIKPCVSVPNGASKGNQVLEYLDNCYKWFVDKKKVILAVDNDEAGLALQDELARRIGIEKCWTLEYPEGCKDTNEVKLKYGSEAVVKMYAEAKKIPLEGVFTGDDISSRVINIYKNGFPRGLKTGYKLFDDHFTVRYGEVTTIVAPPGSGKSEFTDQICARMAARHDSRVGVFSPEQQPPELHASALISKYVGEQIYGKSRMNEMQLQKGMEFINEHFFFMKVGEIDSTIDGILKKALEMVVTKGINILIIDPYNYIEHKIPKGYTETQYISELMTKISNFAKKNLVHIFLIAHPTKLGKDKDGNFLVATMYDIAGSANFFNKTDNGISIARDFITNTVKVYIQKIKFKFIGKVGSVAFSYDAPTGRYAEEGYAYENEMELRNKRNVQEVINFPEPEVLPPPPQLTDINKLPIGSSFAEPPVKSEIEKEFEESFYNEDGSLKTNLNIDPGF